MYRRVGANSYLLTCMWPKWICTYKDYRYFIFWFSSYLRKNLCKSSNPSIFSLNTSWVSPATMESSRALSVIRFKSIHLRKGSALAISCVLDPMFSPSFTRVFVVVEFKYSWKCFCRFEHDTNCLMWLKLIHIFVFVPKSAQLYLIIFEIEKFGFKQRGKKFSVE